MSVLVRATDVPVASRPEYLHEGLRAVLGPLNIRTAEGNELPDQVRAADLGAVHVGELWASRPGGADRTSRHVELMQADLVKVDVVAQGEVDIEQDGRQARLHAGDCCGIPIACRGLHCLRCATWSGRHRSAGCHGVRGEQRLDSDWPSRWPATSCIVGYNCTRTCPEFIERTTDEQRCGRDLRVW